MHSVDLVSFFVLQALFGNTEMVFFFLFLRKIQYALPCREKWIIFIAPFVF